MTPYQTVEAFLHDLPALAAPYGAKLRDWDKLIRLDWGTHISDICLQDGVVSVKECGDDYPSCIIHTDERMALDIVRGNVSPMSALLFGKVRVDGDVQPLLRLCCML